MVWIEHIERDGVEKTEWRLHVENSGNGTLCSRSSHGRICGRRILLWVGTVPLPAITTVLLKVNCFFSSTEKNHQHSKDVSVILDIRLWSSKSIGKVSSLSYCIGLTRCKHKSHPVDTLRSLDNGT